MKLFSLLIFLAYASASLYRQVPAIGEPAPAFTAEAVVDGKFTSVSLSDYADKHWVVLMFYPLDFTFVCPTEVTSYSDRIAEFKALNAEGWTVINSLLPIGGTDNTMFVGMLKSRQYTKCFIYTSTNG